VLLASDLLEPKPVLETFTENHLCKRKVAGECASPATFSSSTTYILRIAILVGVTCHFLEIYIWNGLKKMAGIGVFLAIDNEIPELGSRKILRIGPEGKVKIRTL
jgi:hypothetical protein